MILLQASVGETILFAAMVAARGRRGKNQSRIASFLRIDSESAGDTNGVGSGIRLVVGAHQKGP